MSIAPTFPRILSRRSTSSAPLSFDPHSPTPPIDLQLLFRPCDKIITSQSCRVRTGLKPFVKAEVLVVGTNTSLGEQAAIFILTPPQSNATSSAISHIIPLSIGFKYRLEQAPPSPSTSFFHQSAKPHITLYLSHEHVKVELRISASQTARVQKLVAELRKLSETALLQSIPKTLTHSWTKLYAVEPSPNDEDEDDLGSPEVSTPSALSPSPSAGTLSVDTSFTNLTIGTGTQSQSQSQVDEEDQYPDPYLPSFSRTAFLRKRLFARQENWSSQSDVKIRIATYNVNDKIPPAGTRELAPLVGDGEDDLLVFGFQEVDLRGQALLISQGNVRAEGWEAALFTGLGSKAEDFETLVTTQYVGVMMIVLVRKTLRAAVTRVDTSERGIGLLGFGGNKAGVAVRLRVHDTTLCFVNAHMAAFATALDRRRSDYLVLKTGLTFPQVTDGTTPAFEEFIHDNKERLLNQEDSNVLFWMGDLNYRVDLPDAEVRRLADEQRWSEMLEKDQLRTDIAAEKSFTGFQEHPIDFPPSFKYVHGSTTFDSRRAPAYTDRILWSLPPNTISSMQSLACTEYTSHDILWSDHRPVSASFTAAVRVVDEPTRSAELGIVLKELDRLEEVYRPSLEINQLNLEFGPVRYGRPVEREIKLRNMGRVPATYSFKPPSTDRPFCKPFLWPFPSTAVVEPGQDVVLKVVISVDEAWSAKLTLGEDINDVLVLQIEGGKDTFITIQATYLPSIISLPLHILSGLLTDIRRVQVAERKVLARPLAPSGTNGDAPPKPVRDIWRLLEYLMTYGLGVERLWLNSGDVLDIIEHLDTGTPIPEPSNDDQVKDVASALLHILASLPSPLLPLHHQTACIQAVDRDGAFAALEDVPQINTNVLIGLMSVVRLCSTKPLEENSSTTNTETVQIEDPPLKEERQASVEIEARKEKEAEVFKIEDDGDEENDVKVEEAKESVIAESGNGQVPPLLEAVLAPISSTGASIGTTQTDSIGSAESSTAATSMGKGQGVQVEVEEPSTPKSIPAALDLTEVKENEASEELVDVLIPAIFGVVAVGNSVNEKSGKRRFVRLLLEG